MPNRIEWFEDAPAEARRRGDLGRYKEVHRSGAVGAGAGCRLEFEHGQLVLAPAAVDEEAGTLADSLLELCTAEGS
jgi:hypothetical protein